MRATMHLCGLLLGLLTTCLPAPASEPGLLFHAGFDGTLQAESLARAGEPIADQGPEPVFEPGRDGWPARER